jgi:hypothetical protein
LPFETRFLVVEHYLLTELFGTLVIHASVVGFASDFIETIPIIGQAWGNGMLPEPENSKVVTNPYSFLCWDAQDPDALPFSKKGSASGSWASQHKKLYGLVTTLLFSGSGSIPLKSLAKPTTEAWITRVPKSSVSR